MNRLTIPLQDKWKFAVRRAKVTRVLAESTTEVNKDVKISKHTLTTELSKYRKAGVKERNIHSQFDRAKLAALTPHDFPSDRTDSLKSPTVVTEVGSELPFGSLESQDLVIRRSRNVEKILYEDKLRSVMNLNTYEGDGEFRKDGTFDKKSAEISYQKTAVSKRRQKRLLQGLNIEDVNEQLDEKTMVHSSNQPKRVGMLLMKKRQAAQGQPDSGKKNIKPTSEMEVINKLVLLKNVEQYAFLHNFDSNYINDFMRTNRFIRDAVFQIMKRKIQFCALAKQTSFKISVLVHLLNRKDSVSKIGTYEEGVVDSFDVLTVFKQSYPDFHSLTDNQIHELIFSSLNGSFLAMSKDEVAKNLLISLFVNCNNIERKIILQELTVNTGEFVNLLTRNRYFQQTFTHMLGSTPPDIDFLDKQNFWIQNGPSSDFAVQIFSNPTVMYSFLMNKPKNTNKVILRHLCNRASPEESRRAATSLIHSFLKMDNKHLIINDSRKSEEIKSLMSFALPDEFIEWIADSMDDPLIELDYDPEGTYRYRFFFTYVFSRTCAVNSSYCDVFLQKFISNPALQVDKNLNFNDKILYLNQTQLETLFNHYREDILNASTDYEHHIYRISSKNVNLLSSFTRKISRSSLKRTQISPLKSIKISNSAVHFMIFART